MDYKWKLGDLNKCGTYLLPMLGGNSKHFRDPRSKSARSNFVNCFIGDSEKPELNSHILLLYKFSGNKEFIDFEFWLQSHDQFRGTYEPDRYHTMYIFEVSDQYKEDYTKFKEGKYSSFSGDYKRQIELFHGLSGSDNSKHPVIATLYRYEPGYIFLEGQINKGERDKRFYISIPRDQECSSLPELEIGKEIRFVEIYQPHFKVYKGFEKDVMPTEEYEKLNSTNDENEQ